MNSKQYRQVIALAEQELILTQDKTLMKYLAGLMLCAETGLPFRHIKKLRWGAALTDHPILGKVKLSRQTRLTLRGLWVRGQFNDEDYILSNREGEPVSSIYFNLYLTGLFQRYGFDLQVTTHTLRKFYGRQFIQRRGEDPNTLKELRQHYGHASNQQTLNYIHE